MIYCHESYVRCSCCGKKFSLFFYSRRDYVYKIRTSKHTKYQCSYHCYKKEKDRFEDKRDAGKGAGTKGC